MSLSWINFVTSGNIGFASVRDGPLENLLGGGGGRSTKKISVEGKLNFKKIHARRLILKNSHAKEFYNEKKFLRLENSPPPPPPP